MAVRGRLQEVVEAIDGVIRDLRNYIFLGGIAYVGAGRYLGLGRWWESTALVSRFPVLK